MIKLWYYSDEVNEFHPIVEAAIKRAMTVGGYDTIAVLEHHPTIPNSTIIPDFAIKLKSSNRYVFVIEVKRTMRDVRSQRYQNQARSYVSDFSPYWEPGYPKYFCLTNIEEILFFADRQGPISTCILKDNPITHTPFDATTKSATLTVQEFQTTFEKILPVIFNSTPPSWNTNWQPIVDAFYQNYTSISRALPYASEVSNELALYELFRLLAFTYLKDYYNQTNNLHQKHFKNLPTGRNTLEDFNRRLTNNYNRVLQFGFKQVFSPHPDEELRIIPENLSLTIWHYFKDMVEVLNHYGAQALAAARLPEHIFNLLTSKVYDKATLHKRGQVMSDTELSALLAGITIERAEDFVLDPACGDGALIDAAYDYLKLLNASNTHLKTHNELLKQIFGIEKDPFLGQLATFRLVSKNLSAIDNQTIIDVQIGDSFKHPKPSGYDVVLMNPPYIRNDNPQAPITTADKIRMNAAIDQQLGQNFVRSAAQPNLYFYFVNYAWHYLNDRGRAGIIIMAKFLNSEDGKHLKTFLLDKLEAIILYPRNYFGDFKVTSVIALLSKEVSPTIKFLRIINEDLLANPSQVKSILSAKETSVTSNYSIKVSSRNIDPTSNWKLHFNDPEDTFQRLDSLPFFKYLNTFFTTIKRGGGGNSGGSKIIYPDFETTPFAQLNPSNRGYGIKNNKFARHLILTESDLLQEEAIHFPDKFDETTSNGLPIFYQNDAALNALFTEYHAWNFSKWKKIINSSFRSKTNFDILIPRAERTKHICYYYPFKEAVLISTNFFYLSGLKEEMADERLSTDQQLKFVTAFLNSCFGQIQFEINSNNQEGLRKLEGFHIEQFKIPDLKQLTTLEMERTIEAFEQLNTDEIIISGAEGLNTPRKMLDKSIAQIIFDRNNLGFESSQTLTNFFELFLADLVEDRKL